uniref:RNA-binding protein 28-like n=1 Tax=Myxine glutinosa TaxID=7769 RepID=UPI00358FEA82
MRFLFRSSKMADPVQSACKSTVFVQNLAPGADSDALRRTFEQLGPVKRCFVVKRKGEDEGRGYGYVTFSLASDAQRALGQVLEVDGRRVHLRLANRKVRAVDAEGQGCRERPSQSNKAPATKKSSKKARLIVRNLSFKCSTKDLQAAFSPFGDVLEASIPQKDGKMKGFGFVQYSKIQDAARALKEMNLQQIKGRPVAIDWAIPKDEYEVIAKPQGKAKDTVKHLKSSATSLKLSTPLVSEEEGDEEIDEDEEDDEKGEDENESIDTDELLESDFEGGNSPEPETRPSDVGEGCTIFIRNLSFDTDEEDLEKVLQKFGPLCYIRIVVYPDTERSKGCAFAKFKSQGAAQSCIAEAERSEQDAGIVLDGRKLLVALALSRGEAQQMARKNCQPNDRRNLYLAREGLIRPGTLAAKGLSEADLAKRARFEQMNRKRLRNLNIFVSRTRLCIHNIPKSVDDRQLKQIFIQAANCSASSVKECRIMQDLKQLDSHGRGISRGYAFVEFGDHTQALEALRATNNNPHIFEDQKRLIVEFSLEDHMKLKAKEARLQRAQQKQKAEMEMKRKAKITSKKPIKCAEDQKAKNNAWMGFETSKGKMLALPSHCGPKVRNRDKGKPTNEKLKTKPIKRQKVMLNWKKAMPQEKKSRKNKVDKEEEHFNGLVESYKKKIFGNERMQAEKSRWFEN